MFIPIEEKGQSTIHSPIFIVYALVILNVCVFLAAAFTGNSEEIISRYGFIPIDGFNFCVFYSMFLHMNLMHIAGNMYFLWAFGDNVEDGIGSISFLLCYLVCGFFSAALHMAFNSDSGVPCIGASGAISGVMGMYAVLFPRNKVDLFIEFFRVKSTAIVAILGWLGYQAFLGILSKILGPGSSLGGVAFWAHVGGLLTGLFLGFIFKTLGYPQNVPAKVS